MRSAIMFLFALLISSVSARAQSSPVADPCVSPNALRVGIFNLAPSTNFDGDLAQRLKSSDRFTVALTKTFHAACIVTDASVFDDEKNYPTLNGSIFVMVNAVPSFRQFGFVAVSVDFAIVRGPSPFDRIPVVTQPVLLEPDDTDADLERKAAAVYERYTNVAAALAKIK
jgi:hypothetical protein